MIWEVGLKHTKKYDRVIDLGSVDLGHLKPDERIAVGFWVDGHTYYIAGIELPDDIKPVEEA